MGSSSEIRRPGGAGAPTQAGGKDRSRVDQLLGMGLFVLVAVLWAGFAIALIVNQGSLDAAWDWVRGLPLIAQVVVWMAFLPVVAGLWVWHTDWMLIVRVVVIAGIAVANLYLFRPRGVSTLKG